MAAHDAAERSIIGRMGALTRLAREDPREMTKPARAGFMARFLRQVDEECPGLPEPERQRRADCLLRLHMTKLARKSAKANKRKARRRARQIERRVAEFRAEREAE